MIYSCSSNYSNTSFVSCNGSLTGYDDEGLQGRYVACSVPYTLQSNYLYCSGSVDRAQTIADLDSSYYLFMSDNVVLSSGYLNLPDSDLETMTVSDYEASLVVTPDPDTGTGNYPALTSADYSALITAALPVLVVAFSFRFLYRLIINR